MWRFLCNLRPYLSFCYRPPSKCYLRCQPPHIPPIALNPYLAPSFVPIQDIPYLIRSSITFCSGYSIKHHYHGLTWGPTRERTNDLFLWNIVYMAARVGKYYFDYMQYPTVVAQLLVIIFRQSWVIWEEDSKRWFWDDRAKTEFGQSGLTWLYSGDPATGSGVPRPFRFWKKSNQTDLGCSGKKLNQCIKGLTLMVHIQTQQATHVDKNFEKETPLRPILPAIV